MAIRTLGFVLPVMLLLAVVGAQNATVLYCGCNVTKFPLVSPFYDTLLAMLVEMEDTTGYDDYYYQKPSPGSDMDSAPIYGQATCNGVDLSPEQCKACLFNLVNDNLFPTCGLAVGAQILLVDCYIRYEQYYFF